MSKTTTRTLLATSAALAMALAGTSLFGSAAFAQDAEQEAYLTAARGRATIHQLQEFGQSGHAGDFMQGRFIYPNGNEGHATTIVTENGSVTQLDNGSVVYSDKSGAMVINSPTSVTQVDAQGNSVTHGFDGSVTVNDPHAGLGANAGTPAQTGAATPGTPESNSPSTTNTTAQTTSAVADNKAQIVPNARMSKLTTATKTGKVQALTTSQIGHVASIAPKTVIFAKKGIPSIAPKPLVASLKPITTVAPKPVALQMKPVTVMLAMKLPARR